MLQGVCGTKMFRIEGQRVPAVMSGTSPFIGAGQFCSRAGDYYERFYREPKNIVDVMLEAVCCGVASVVCTISLELWETVENPVNPVQLSPWWHLRRVPQVKKR